MTVTKEMIEAASFLVDRLEEFERELNDDAVGREYYGHVHPAFARLVAALSRSAEAGKPVVTGWQPIETAPKDGTVVDLWHEEFGRHADQYWGLAHHDCGEAGRYCDSDWHDTPEGWVDSSFNQATFIEEFSHWMFPPSAPGLSALSTPADSEPVAWLFEGEGWGKEMMLSHKDALERKERLSGTLDIKITPLYAAANADTTMADAVKNALGLLDTPVGRRRHAGDSFYNEVVASLRAALAAPVADGEPVSVPEGWTLRHDNFKRWCIFGPDDRWYMQPVGMITADEARIVCERASALAAAPQRGGSGE